MRFAVFCPHFLPRYLGGVEFRAKRMARWLLERSHELYAASIESISHRGKEALCQDEIYEGIPVRRIHFNQAESPDPFRWSFFNPLLEDVAGSFFEEIKPDILFFFSGHIISGSVISAAKERSIPVLLMTTDYWFLCPRITLLKPEGSLCGFPENVVECAVCLSQDRRRYRCVSTLTGGYSNRILTQMWGFPFIARGMGKRGMLEALMERRLYLRKLFERIDAAVSESRFLMDFLLSRGFDPPRFLQIRQGLRLPAKGEFPKKRQDSPFCVGYLGQIAPHKGLDVLLRAFNRLNRSHPQSVLKIYGDLSRAPKYVEHLRSLARRGKMAEFCGAIPNEKVYEILSDIDVLVVPSLWYENSPNVILEAFASGTPVVASNSGGMAELVRDGIDGLLFRRGDNLDLARKMQRLIEEPGLLGSLSRRKHSLKTEDQEMEEIVGLSERLIAESKKGANHTEKKICLYEGEQA